MNFNNLYNTPEFQRFWQPTRLLFGNGAKDKTTDLLRAGDETVLVVDKHYTSHPYLDKLAAKLGPWLAKIVVDGEPYTRDTLNALELIDNRSWNQLLALGGGSTLDLAKSLLAHRTFGAIRQVGYGPLRDIEDRWPVETGCCFVAMPTTAGTGSETSRYYLLSDVKTRQKLVSRSWALCPTYAVLDPDFIREMPEPLLVMGAFDAFTHLWETFFCAQEASPMVSVLAEKGVRLIVQAMHELESVDALQSASLGDLQLASAWGGVALSNVRTGLLHTSGEALSAQVGLPHPLTLWVFFSANMRLFNDGYRTRGRMLFQALSDILSCSVLDCLAALEDLWRRAFERTACIARIHSAINAVVLEEGSISEKILLDRVLITKEAPKTLDEDEVRGFVGKAMQAWAK